jgi:hypothetical protein
VDLNRFPDCGGGVGCTSSEKEIGEAALLWPWNLAVAEVVFRQSPFGPAPIVHGHQYDSAIVKSKIKSTHGLVVNEQGAPGSRAPKELSSRDCFAWIDDLLVSSSVEITATEVVAI